tara:strand:+ start:131 stop:355 length:225 start_codon:yes stop_codon:yes gene_type:complete
VFKEKNETMVVIKQKRKKNTKNLLLNISYFLLIIVNKIKLIVIITNDKSGINGPDIRDSGINTNNILDKFISLF